MISKDKTIVACYQLEEQLLKTSTFMSTKYNYNNSTTKVTPV